MYKMPLFIIFTIQAFLLWADTSYAHRVILFAYSDNGVIHVEGSFPGGKPAMGVDVIVQSPDASRTFLAGKTDDNGSYSFPVPQEATTEQSDLLIVLDAGLGHRAEWTVPAAEYLTGGSEKSRQPKDMRPVLSMADTTANPPRAQRPETSATAQAALDEHLLAQLLADQVNDQLERRLEPILQRLAKKQDNGPGITEIFGGIGWIMGLVGLYAWGKSKNR